MLSRCHHAVAFILRLFDFAFIRIMFLGGKALVIIHRCWKFEKFASLGSFWLSNDKMSFGWKLVFRWKLVFGWKLVFRWKLVFFQIKTISFQFFFEWFERHNKKTFRFFLMKKTNHLRFQKKLRFFYISVEHITLIGQNFSLTIFETHNRKVCINAKVRKEFQRR